MKLIHCGDLHLDSPMGTHMTAQEAARRNAEITGAFLRLTDYAKENGVRAVLIAGDLFDGERVTRRTVNEVVDAMAATPEVDYLYIPGNHDGAARAFSDLTLPSNFIQFSKAWATVRYEDAAISGIEMCQENAQSLYDTLPQPEKKPHIVMLHGQVGTQSGEDLVNLSLLRNRGIDYLALGHLHSYAAEELDARGVYAYCGCLEGRGFDECGPKGFVLLEAKAGKVTHSFVPFAQRQLHRVGVDVSGMEKNSQVRLAMLSAAEGIPKDDMVEFLLRGGVGPECEISPDYLQTQLKGNFYFLKVKNQTTLAISPEDYENDISLKGEFIRLVLGSDEPEEKKENMIRLGLQALAGEELTL